MSTGPNFKKPGSNPKDNNIVEASFRSRNLTRDAADALILRLYSLTAVNLSHNRISEFPNCFPPKLIALNLSYNMISTIPRDNRLTSLVELHLKGNHLTETTNLLMTTSLKYLDLSYNMITCVKGLETHSNLLVLLLGCNNIRTTKDIRTLSFNRKLNTLVLEGNPVAKDPGYRLVVANLIPSMITLDGKVLSQRKTKFVTEKHGYSGIFKDSPIKGHLSLTTPLSRSASITPTKTNLNAEVTSAGKSIRLHGGQSVPLQGTPIERPMARGLAPVFYDSSGVAIELELEKKPGSVLPWREPPHPLPRGWKGVAHINDRNSDTATPVNHVIRQLKSTPPPSKHKDIYINETAMKSDLSAMSIDLSESRSSRAPNRLISNYSGGNANCKPRMRSRSASDLSDVHSTMRDPGRYVDDNDYHSPTSSSTLNCSKHLLSKSFSVTQATPDPKPRQSFRHFIKSSGSQIVAMVSPKTESSSAEIWMTPELQRKPTKKMASNRDTNAVIDRLGLPGSIPVKPRRVSQQGQTMRNIVSGNDLKPTLQQAAHQQDSSYEIDNISCSSMSDNPYTTGIDEVSALSTAVLPNMFHCSDLNLSFAERIQVMREGIRKYSIAIANNAHHGYPFVDVDQSNDSIISGDVNIPASSTVSSNDNNTGPTPSSITLPKTATATITTTTATTATTPPGNSYTPPSMLPLAVVENKDNMLEIQQKQTASLVAALNVLKQKRILMLEQLQK